MKTAFALLLTVAGMTVAAGPTDFAKGSDLSKRQRGRGANCDDIGSLLDGFGVDGFVSGQIINQCNNGRNQLRKSAKEPQICLEENQLTAYDWTVLKHLATLLGFYEDAVKTLEGDGQQRKRKGGWVGSYGNVWEVI
ncbi:hypothetical protein VFPPC_17142 [Pochonia chlamydosporia 170]|uniref:Uncharacterized protein n=1 Tax=Pochonia chlamydosporia 170 TaxID=1380566 RepID=A0A179EX24_METCM|nr:hypothetical protein VFPPC_17142 [Pochonia chlamydosporia 170]OAQ57570.1 hypothetical protein VFPPC_17142 [Pochonia chlamydosporia 170]